VDKTALIYLAYLIAAVLFILGLKGITHPRSAVRGNLLGALGMFVAVVATLFHQNIMRYELIIAGVIIGATIGVVLAVKIQMTAMPQLVALFNGFGGGASVLVAGPNFGSAAVPGLRQIPIRPWPSPPRA
jgi:NAD(P) transhydrogenase subunit beta